MAQAAVGLPVLAAKKRQSAGSELKHKGSEQSSDGSPVYVVLWFDTEDYILPQSDDVDKRLAEFLTKEGIRATFKIVGDKARALVRRGRWDVIASLSSQEIGYHSNHHSQQPTPAVYESVLDWESGKEEFTRREYSGFELLTQIFGRKPTCYGQPGVSWAPQTFPALHNWGVHVYLDDGPQVQLAGKPFWYGRLLNIFHIDAGQDLEPNAEWSNLEQVKANFAKLHASISAQPPGGLVSFMFHPTQLISKEFWDVTNFANGANPPQSQWRMQPLNPPAVRERAFDYVEGLVRYIKSFPNVHFVTASEAYSVYGDAAQSKVFSPEEIGSIAGNVSAQISYQRRQGYSLSSSEVFSLLNGFVAQFVTHGSGGSQKLLATPYGPSSHAFGVKPTLGDKVTTVVWNQFSRTVVDVQSYLEEKQEIPNAIWCGSTSVTPESYLLSLSQVTNDLLRSGKSPASVDVAPAVLRAARWIPQDSVSIWNWPIFPPGFHSAHLMELAALQAWTLKPAVLRDIDNKNRESKQPLN